MTDDNRRFMMHVGAEVTVAVLLGVWITKRTGDLQKEVDELKSKVDYLMKVVDAQNSIIREHEGVLNPPRERRPLPRTESGQSVARDRSISKDRLLTRDSKNEMEESIDVLLEKELNSREEELNSREEEEKSEFRERLVDLAEGEEEISVSLEEDDELKKSQE